MTAACTTLVKPPSAAIQKISMIRGSVRWVRLSDKTGHKPLRALPTALYTSYTYHMQAVDPVACEYHGTWVMFKPPSSCQNHRVAAHLTSLFYNVDLYDHKAFELTSMPPME